MASKYQREGSSNSLDSAGAGGGQRRDSGYSAGSRGSYSQHDDRTGDGRYSQRDQGGYQGSRGMDSPYSGGARGGGDDRRRYSPERDGNSPMTPSRGYDNRSDGRDSYGRGGAPRSGGGSFRGGGAADREEREKDAAPREQGFVKTVRESYGFVQCADSEEQLFFHFSELKDAEERSLRPGSEIEYGVYNKPGGDKPMAVRVVVLPKGTIETEVFVAADVKATINKEPKESKSAFRNPKDNCSNGRVKIAPDQAKEGADQLGGLISFGLDDCADLADGGGRYTPAEGDEVLVDIFMVRASKQKKACNVRLVKAVPKKEEPREQGIIERLKDNFGFIKCADREERLFFHASEMADKNYIPRAGDEVDFTVTTDRENRHVASNVKILPKGTVKFVIVLEGRVRGVVERELRAQTSGQRKGFARDERKDMYGGLILHVWEEEVPEKAGRHRHRKHKGKGTSMDKSFDASMSMDDEKLKEMCGEQGEEGAKEEKPEKSDQAGSAQEKSDTAGGEGADATACDKEKEEKKSRKKQEKLAFDGEDMEDQRNGMLPQVGDEVEFNICIDRPTKKRRATAVKVVAYSKTGREQGVVQKIKEGCNYAFIKCCDREDQVFFHFSECEGNIATAGDEVEFVVSEGKNDNRLTATRISKLPPGTVSFERVLEGRYEGVVEKAIASSAGGQGNKKGKETLLPGLIMPSQPIEGEKMVAFNLDGDDLKKASIDLEGKDKRKSLDLDRKGKSPKIAPMSHLDTDWRSPQLKAMVSPETDEKKGGKVKPSPKISAMTPPLLALDKGAKLNGPETRALSFTSSDMENHSCVLCKGDKVSFSVIVDRPTGRKRAQKVQLVEAVLSKKDAAAPSESGPHQGIITQIKGAHGFVRCADRDLRVYLQFSDIDPESYVNSIAAAPEASQKDKSESMPHKDKEGHAHEHDGQDASGDQSASLSQEESHKDAQSGEEDGGATKSGEEDHQEEHEAEGQKKEKQRKPKVGDEVEFMLHSDHKTRVYTAVKVRILPKGTAQFEVEEEGRHKGEVHKELQFKLVGKDTLTSSGGQVKLVEGDKTTMLHFDSSDMQHASQQVKHGDTIEFSVFRDKATGERRAGNIHVSPSEGYVESLKDAYGFIRVDEDHTPQHMGKLILFYLSDVEKGDQGKVDRGDSVSFFLNYSIQKKEITATKVKRTFRPKEPREARPEHMKRQAEVPKVVQRLAHGPDGTKGFNQAGRGKPPPGYYQMHHHLEAVVDAPVFVPGVPIVVGQFKNA